MIVIIVLQLILHYTKKEHHVDYTLMVDDQKYEITEMFSYDHQQSVYTLSLANQKKTFHFQFLEDYHKQSKVVEDIIAVSNDDISCVYPILKDNRASYVRCRDQENEFSYTVLQDKDPQLADKVVESLKEQKIDVVTESSSSKTYEGLTYYPTALDDIILSIWNYRGLYYLGAEQEENITFLQADQYENHFAPGHQTDAAIHRQRSDYAGERYVFGLCRWAKRHFEIRQRGGQFHRFFGALCAGGCHLSGAHLCDYESV